MSDIKSSINQVIEEQNIPFEWSQIIFDELENIDIEFSDSRVDLSDKPFVTIDGKDAKDFDDAVLCEKNIEGFNLWVAIADVAEIVNKNSEIDKEAFKRGTSIYFPNTVIPMLPEKISNNICSLVPNEKRNVLVCEINFNADAEIESYDFFEAVICSAHRFTYNEVLEYKKSNSQIVDSLESLKILTNKLLKNRQKRSALEIESQEPSLIINDDGSLEKINLPKRLFSHQMIEESMIAANICAAKFIKKHIGFGIFRVHEEPDFIKVDNLKKFFSLKGYSSKALSNPIDQINSFIKHSAKAEEKKVLNVLILQSLKRAKYSTNEIGHFGLQLEEYSHFTSPIRRYPDLIAHRIIKSILKKSRNEDSRDFYEEALEELSNLEKRAEVSSRQVIQQMICHKLKNFIGDEFSTHVVGVAEFGLFCEIENYFISGLIHVSDLRKDRYIFDSQANILKGRRTGKTYRVGQSIKVQLVNVSPEERKITLIPK